MHNRSIISTLGDGMGRCAGSHPADVLAGEWRLLAISCALRSRIRKSLKLIPSVDVAYFHLLRRSGTHDDIWLTEGMDSVI